MTKASVGLGNALARAGTKVLALGEMSVEDILANLTEEQRAQLHATASAAALTPPPAPAASADDDGDTDEMKPGEDKCSKCSEPMKDGKCSKCEPGAKADAFAAANQRALAVMGSEHFAANSKLAQAMLGNNKLSADEIVGYLAIASASAPAHDPAAAEEAQRAEMRAAMGASRNSNIDAGNGGAGANNSQVDHSAGWSKAAAKANQRYSLTS